MIESYRDLEVWQRAMELAEATYQLCELLPHQEKYGLRAQLQRSAVSIPSNLAEGHARSSTRDYLRFVSIALGSLAELETQLVLAGRIHGLPEEKLNAMLQEADQLGRKLRGLQKSLNVKLAGADKHSPQPPAPSPQPR
jgi:four helix bundle protein